MIRAKSVIKTINVGGIERPLVKDFTEEVWKRLPSINTQDGKLHPKMGFVQIAKEGEVNVPKGDIKPAKPAQDATPSETGTADTDKGYEDFEFSTIIKAVQEEEEESLRVNQELRPAARALDININQNRTKLLEAIKTALNEKGIL